MVIAVILNECRLIGFKISIASIISRQRCVIITGAFEEGKALALVQKYLGAIPKPERKLDATYTEEPPQDGERNV